MPLFRRIGQMLGLRQSETPEYVYAPEAEAVTADERHVEPELVNAPLMQQVDVEEAAPVQAAATTEDILGIDSVSEPEPQTELQPLSSESQIAPAYSVAEPEPESLAVYNPPVSTPVLAREMEAANEEVAPEIVSTRLPEEAKILPVEMPQVATSALPLTQEDARNLVAQVREAALKISAAVSQAAEWLHAKEADILRRAEMPLEPQQRAVEKSQSAQPVQFVPPPILLQFHNGTTIRKCLRCSVRWRGSICAIILSTKARLQWLRLRVRRSPISSSPNLGLSPSRPPSRSGSASTGLRSSRPSGWRLWAAS